jgi:Rnl2 family RNA ligase
MKFRKYSSIENSTLHSFIEKIEKDGFAEEEFVVQEKVHGSNLSVLTNGKDIRFAKRTEIIDDEESFFRVDLFRNRYEQRILNLFDSLKSEFELETLTVFGEYFGGYYPHKSVPKNKFAKTIQKLLSQNQFETSAFV